MKNFIKYFRREGHGVWVCTGPAEVTLPDGRRIQVTAGSRFARGAKFMNVELAALLDAEYERQRAQGG